jgi:hypothetical protein
MEQQTISAAIDAFIVDSQNKINSHYQKNLPNLPVPQLAMMPGSKYVRIVLRDVVSRSAWAFVDRTNGNVLKAASWKAPAKHARANVFDPTSWTTVTSYGPAYLR